ncbi:aminotransferase class I/II-fold pyridoxal phosphate-dependent enzyme, partial [Staphylococcus aureus]
DIQSLPVININNQFIEIEPKTPESKQYKYAFNLAEIDAEYFPLNLFRKYAKEAFEDNELALLEKGDIQGELNLRQQIAHYLFNSRGVSCHPNQIVIGSSTEQLLNMITDLLKTSSFIIEKPSYPPIKHVLDKNKHNYIQATVEKDGINMID